MLLTSIPHLLIFILDFLLSLNFFSAHLFLILLLLRLQFLSQLFSLLFLLHLLCI